DEREQEDDGDGDRALDPAPDEEPDGRVEADRDEQRDDDLNEHGAHRVHGERGDGDGEQPEPGRHGPPVDGGELDRVDAVRGLVRDGRLGARVRVLGAVVGDGHGFPYRARSTQNSLPSGSASTIQVTSSPWPTSTCRAPMLTSRSTSASRLSGL